MPERTINAPVEVDLGNGKLKLLFDMDIMISMEEAGFTLDDLRVPGKTFTSLRRLLWFGAQRAHPELKLEEIGPMVDMRQLDRVSQDVNQALESQLPPKKETNPPPPPAIQ